jgi:ribosomal protein S18 acetylase RimI-like enzyme
MVDVRKVTGAHAHDSELVREIARVFCSAREERLKFLLDLHDIDEDCRFLSEVVLRDNSVWVAEVEGKIAGFIAFDKGWVNHLYIDPPFQRKGIGHDLLGIPKQSNDHLQLWVFEINAPAISFYEREEFREVKRTDGSGNEAKKPDVLMEWRRTIAN